MSGHRVLVYGDVNLNYRDGSAVWLRSTCAVWARAGATVEVLLKADAPNDALAGLRDQPGLVIHTPFDDRRSGMAGMAPRQAAQRIVFIDEQDPFDVVLTRGFGVASYLALSGHFDDRLWAYLTEGPVFEFRPSAEGKRLAAAVTASARRILVQTEQARAMVEALAPGAAGKTIVTTPIVPDEAFDLGATRGHAAGLDMVYTGKFARHWKTLEMVDLPERLAAEGIGSSLTMVGDKVQLTGGDHDWVAAMQAARTSERPGVAWLGGMERAAALAESARHELGLCWRDPWLDGSHEISTKMLEFAAVGTAPVLNRTAMHEELLGADYPLFIDRGDVMETLRRAAADPAIVQTARERASQRVKPYSLSASADRLRGHLLRALGDGADRERRVRPHRVLLAGHDLKFAGELIEMIRQQSRFELRIDKWERLAVHDEAASREAAAWADTIICEWAGPNAVFYSRLVRPEQRLIVRFHGFEIRGTWLSDIEVDKLDAVVFVSDFYRRQVLAATGWPEGITTVIPNAVDVVDLDRPKLEGAGHRLGLAGFVPMLKRPDRALDLLEGLLEQDPRWRLHFRGRMPWDYQWEWDKPLQRSAYETFFHRIATSARLTDCVVFEGFGADMGSWFRSIGWMLSPSTRETFHLAPVEGMASGAIPVVWQHEGAEEVFGADLVQASTEDAVDFVLSQQRTWAERSREMKERARRYDVATVRGLWFELVSRAPGEPVPFRGVPVAVAGWFADPSLVIPAGSNVPALDVVPDRIVGVASVASPDDVAAEPAPPSARDDVTVHVLADSLARSVRRERASSIAAPDVPGPEALAAAIAGRRLGVPVVWREGAGVSARPAWAPLHARAREVAAVHEAKRLDEVRVGIIADRFTSATLAATLPVVELRRATWREQLREGSLDAILVESAWEGRDKEWFHGIAYHGEDEAADLWALLDTARTMGMPTLFWNKEDPVHFRSFQIPAARFDHVFTTDAAMIPRYLATPGTRNLTVSAMPFFAQPALHHPLADMDFSGSAIAFAGSFYGKRYAARSAELAGILREAIPFGLTIYDRQHGNPDSPYQFPDEFQPYSRGAVDYAEMADVYRRHRIHINVNSVQDSPSMFSRRVVEIAASGSVVLSGAGRGVAEVLGPDFPVLTSPEQWRSAFAELTGDLEAWVDLAARQQSTVLAAHRADQALALMLRTAGIAVDPAVSS